MEKGVIKSDTQATRDHLLKQMRETYKGVVDHVWDAWSDSFIVSGSRFSPSVFSSSLPAGADEGRAHL